MRSRPGSGRTCGRRMSAPIPSRDAHGRRPPDGRRPRALAGVLPRVHRPRRARAGATAARRSESGGRACSSSSRSRVPSLRPGAPGSSTSPCCCPTGEPRALARACRARARPPVRRLRPLRQRGDLPQRSRQARDRDLPRPPARALGGTGRRPHGHRSARSQRPAGRARRPRDGAVRSASPTARRWATSTCRSRTSRRASSSTATCSASA